MDDLRPHSEAEKFLHLPYSERWEKLRPVIVKLYIDKAVTMAEVSNFMKTHYSFHAAVNQYKTRLREWNVRRRTIAEEKDAIVQALGKRKHPGTSTSDVTIRQGDTEKPVNKKQMTRYLRAATRHLPVPALSPGALSSWNLPYAAFSASLSIPDDQPSPLGTAAATPPYLEVRSPEGFSPAREGNGPSPAMQLLRQKVLGDQFSHFLNGRQKELLATLARDDRIILTNYLHDFFVHSFVTAKYWGRGPRDWSASMVSALMHGSLDIDDPRTPAQIESPVTSNLRTTSTEVSRRLIEPTPLCMWSIHVNDIRYEPTPGAEPQPGYQDVFDVQNPRSWPEWPDQERFDRSFPTTMQESIRNSTFSAQPPENLPIDPQLIAQAIQSHPALSLADAWKFAIMAGNIELFNDLFESHDDDVPPGFDDLHPFHLAAAYLDGGNKCCGVITTLFQYLSQAYIRQNNVDKLGNTVLDALLVSILRSHTTVNPGHVNNGFLATNRYPGEEKDICGRWDADSPAIRQLFQNGHPRIPTGWKHPFCHTSVQAVIHSIIAIYGSPACPSIDAPSGLFVRHCSHCGLRLQLGPLHTLVVVAFYLAQSGMPGETLFGAIAVLVCLLSLGADDTSKVSVSVNDILGGEEHGGCRHLDLNPRELADAVPQTLIAQWQPDCQTGWHCFLRTLHLSERGEVPKKEDVPVEIYEVHPEAQEDDLWQFLHREDSPMGANASNSSASFYTEEGNCVFSGYRNLGVHSDLMWPCGNPELGLLWATVQVELLTYRRVKDDLPWISANFSMDALKTWLEGKSDGFRTGLVEKKIMRPHSICGWFHEPDPTAQDVCNGYFMNMDIFERASYLEKSGIVDIWVDYVG